MSKQTSVTIGLENPKSPSNVDVVMRAAGCYQADRVLYTGRRYIRAAQYNSDKHDSRSSVPLMGVKDLLLAKPEGATLVCVDLIIGATPLPKYQHPNNAYYIFGPEDGTIAQNIIDVADEVVYVPTYKCMNLAASVNVLLYDRMAKGDCAHAGQQLIRRVRNTNNRATLRGADPF